MKNVCIASACAVMLFVLSCLTYDLHSKQQRIASVDINLMIHRTAEGFAKSALKEDQLHLRLAHFKKGLSTSLDEFAKEHRVVLIPSHLVHGDVHDMTEQFIAYHNSDPEKGGQK